MDLNTGIPKMYTVPQTAIALNVTKAKIYGLVASGTLPCVVLGPKTFRIKESDLLSLIG